MPDYTLKVDENGAVLLGEKGMPLYTDTDGKDVELDVNDLVGRLNEANGESAARRHEIKDLKATLELFKGIDDLPAWKKSAEEAIETVKNYSEKDLVEAGKVDEIKAQMKAAHDQNLEEVRNEFKSSMDEKDAALAAKDATIFNLMVSQQFSQSPFFVGSDANPSKTLLPPEMGESYFGKHFRVEEGNNGGLVVVGYHDAGSFTKQIYSRKKPGELGDFEECIAALIEGYPNKDQILRPTGPGSGATGGTGTKGATGNRLQKLKEEYKKAEEAKDGKRMVALKGQIFREEQQLHQAQQGT